MREINAHGLSRYVPRDIARAIRKNSKFGCVICRKGFYQYEHIDPGFVDAKEHSAEHMCCLCAGCHAEVTAGRYSKNYVKRAYDLLRVAKLEDVPPPTGPLDFHDGNAQLLFGGINYFPAVVDVINYHGVPVVQVFPGEGGEPGRISAVFADADGNPTMWLEDNSWYGAVENWDIEITGQRIRVKSKEGVGALKLRLEPPGKIVVEELDMRLGCAHILADESVCAAGVYLGDGSVAWVHAMINILAVRPGGACIEFTTQAELELRDVGVGRELAVQGRNVVINGNEGVLVKSLGVAIASRCGAFDLQRLTIGVRTLDEMRREIRRRPESLASFICSK